MQASHTFPVQRTRIKLCGFTRQEDVTHACALGADALGFVFYERSARYVSPEQAASLVAGLAPFVSTVALFVNSSRTFVQEVLSAVRPTYLQFHGDETPAECEAYEWPYLKAFRVGAPGLETTAEIEKTCLAFDSAAGWLFDSYTPAYGGSGHGFDRDLLQGVRENPQSRPLILSGGLTSENVSGLVESVQPWAVDVSSGIETARGIKCADKMGAFVRAVRDADTKDVNRR